jgi:hypothetical protein
MRVALALFVAALPLGSSARAMADSNPVPSCAATQVHNAPNYGFADIPREVPWIVAKPKSAHLIGFLFFVPPGATGQDALMHTNGIGPNGGTDKILWYATQGKTTRTLTVMGRNTSSTGTIRQAFSVAGSGGDYHRSSICQPPAVGN